MQQYWDVKSAHEDKVVLFRMGDFFEMFHRDAEIAAPVLGIALTSRNKKSENPEPMCGVPHHSIANSINKLLSNGFKVAICDQIEDPKFAKGLVKRAVTRILSPGVVYDPDTLDGFKPNYIASFDDQSVSFLDTTTGEAFYFKMTDVDRLDRILVNLDPVEVVLSEEQNAFFKTRFESRSFHPLTTVHGALFADRSQGWPESALRLLAYAVHMQGEKVLSTIQPFEAREILDRMELPATVIRHLEIFETNKGETNGSLFNAINKTKTSSGSRLLKQWLMFPLLQPAAIMRRLDRIDYWVKKSEDLKQLRRSLDGIGDIHRRLGKLGNPSCHPRDLQALGESLQAGLEVSGLDQDTKWDMSLLKEAHALMTEIKETIVDEPPVHLRNGGVIKSSVDDTLDELIRLATNSNQLILDLENREREATGISSLKVRYNNVFGYYIEITHTHKDKVPKDRYDRKQTLANAERYTTKELTELESKVLTAQAKRLELEVELFNRLVSRALSASLNMQKLANQWAELDVVSSLAWLAIEQNYCRPEVSQDGSIVLTQSRHPVIEQSLKFPFVANDLTLTKSGCLLLTGPNMAGKSTLMRQIALAAIMAQMGSFVPASQAKLPLFSQIFTRIGASDFLSEGLSTFMVEMKETAEMLEMADENTLVILDEVGRGTSTFDGMSLAQAILEFLLENRRSMTLFATHYHELTALSSTYPQLMNAHMSIHEKAGAHGPEITFLHQLLKGPANKSYGIHVGRLAGLPSSVTKRAASILKQLEATRKIDAGVAQGQMSLLGQIDRGLDVDPEHLEPSPEIQMALDSIRKVKLESLTPLEALNQIAKWQQSLS